MNAHTVGWLVVLAIMTNVSSSNEPIFKLVTGSLTAKEGSCVEISCQVNDRVKATGAHWFWIKDIDWKPPGFTGTIIYSSDTSLRPVSADFADRVKEIDSLLPDSGGYLTISQKSTIELCNLNKSDIGSYSFRFDGEIRWVTDLVGLQVEDNPCLITFEQPPVMKENDLLTLTCSTLSSCRSNPVIKSLRPKSPTLLSLHPENYNNRRSIWARFNVNWQHDGEEFSCQTDDSDEDLIKQISLTVEYAPRDTRAEKHPADVVEGGSVTLRCSAKGRPDPDFTWFRSENEVIGVGGEHKIPFIQGSQSGEFNCEAKNKLGTMESNPVNINVTYPPEVEVRSPPATVIQGGAMTLTCHVKRSNPRPHTFTWFKDGKNLGKKPTERYVIEGVEPEDAGDYKCSAINVRGEGTSEPFRVQVEYGPRNTTISISEATGNTIRTVLITLFILLSISLIVVVNRKTKKSSQQAATNTCGLGFMWNPFSVGGRAARGIGRRTPLQESLSGAGMTTCRTSCTIQRPHDAGLIQTAPDIDSIYCNVNQPSGQHSDERQEDYENAISAHVARDQDPWSYNTDTSEEEVEVHHSQVSFTAKPGRGGGGRDSSSSEGDKTRYSEVKV